MTFVAARSRLFDLLSFRRPPVVLCLGVIAIGVIVLSGYVLGNASIAALSANAKPVAAGTALAFIVLGAGLLALRWPAPAGPLAARWAALAVIVLTAADLLSATLALHIEEWQVWGARGGVIVHPYLTTALLLLASASALFFITTRRDFSGHVLASTVLSAGLCLLLGHILKVPSFLDPSGITAPVPVTACGLVLLSVAELLARPRGWVVPLLAPTSAGMRERLLLAAVIVVPFVALGLRTLIADAPWYSPEVGLALIIAVNIFFSAWIVLGLGVFLHKRESDRLRSASIVDSSVDAIIGISSEGLIESWNRGAERMYGYTAAETIGRSIAMLVPAERHDEVPLLIERARRGEQADPFETVRVAKDGRHVDVWLSVSPVLDEDGNVVGASSVEHDITGRKKDEEVIRRMADQYATMLATTSDGFWLVDLDGRLLEVNDAYCRMSGYSRDELLKRRIGDIEAAETPEPTASRIRSILEAGFARFEAKHRTKDNRILDIECSVSLLRTTGQMLVFTRDVTERNQAHEGLRSSEERLQLAQEAAGIGYFSWDIQNDVISRSAEMLALNGLASVGIGRGYGSWSELIFPDDRPATEAEIQRALTSGELSCDYRVVWPDGSIHWLYSRAKVFFSDDGKPLRMLGVDMDISERKRTEESLRKSEAALKEAQRIAQVGHWEWSALTGATTFSEEAYRILGIPIGSVTPSYELLFTIIAPGERRRMEEEIARVIGSPDDGGGSGTVDMDLPITTPAGEERVVSQRVWVDRDAAGNAVGFHGTCQDITQRVEAEKALREGEMRYHELFAANPHPMWIYDLETLRFLEVNDAAVAHYGYRRDEFQTMTISNIRPSADVPRLLGVVSAASKSAFEDSGSWKHRTKDGAIIDVEITSHTLDYGGRRAKVVLAHDITRRVATEKALRESEAALAEAQQIARVGSAIFYPETREVHASDEYFRIFDLEPQPGTPTRAFLDRVHEEDRGAVQVALEAALSSGTFDVEFRIVCGDGSTRFAHGIARKRAGNERMAGLLGTVEDVTERKRAEHALLQHSESLERSNFELERFNRLSVGRELRMIELKQQINDLCRQLGQPPPHVLPEEHAVARETS